MNNVEATLRELRRHKEGFRNYDDITDLTDIEEERIVEAGLEALNASAKREGLEESDLSRVLDPKFLRYSTRITGEREFMSFDELKRRLIEQRGRKNTQVRASFVIHLSTDKESKYLLEAIIDDNDNITYRVLKRAGKK
jgi:hypothetical protein